MKFSNRGLTLSELLLTAAILAFVLTGILLIFINGIFLNEANHNLTIAASHAQYVMEELKAETSLQNIKDKIDAVTFTQFQSLPNEAISVCCCDFPCDACLDSCPDDSDPLGVSVRVDWRDRGARDRYTELKTQITDYQ